GGFTGEGALLSAEEKRELWNLAAASAGPEKTLIAGIESPGVRNAAALVNQAAELRYAAALVETLHGARIETQLLYFRALADRTNIPILISNRAGADVAAIAALSGHPNIRGVVAHSGDVSCIPRWRGFDLLWGAAGSLWSALQSGASGAVL